MLARPSRYIWNEEKKVKVSLYDPLMSVNLFIFALDRIFLRINAHMIIKQTG